MSKEKGEKKFSLERRINYPQPHNIHIHEEINFNPLIEERAIEYLHARAKYLEKYWRSKQRRRLYSSPNYR